MSKLVMYILRGVKYFSLNYIVSWIPFYVIRYSILRYFYRLSFHKTACIHIGVKFFGPGSLGRIGATTVINPECRLDLRGGLEIGDNVSISREVFILTLTHDYNKSDFPLVKGKVKISNNAWIGIRAIIMPGVTVGEGAVIGAGSIVTKDVPPYSIAVGSPAKVVAQREKNDFDSVYYKPFMSAET